MERLKKIKNIIKQDFDIDTHNGISTVLFYLPYSPYKLKADTAGVDSFYQASNSVYKLAEVYAERLKNEGVPCIANPRTNYKEAAKRCGHSAGKNTLIYRKGCGSRFVIGALQLDEIINSCFNSGGNVQMLCQNCDICRKACPFSAIGASAEEFDKKKCIRTYMLKPESADLNVLNALQGSILGCDICQRVCPVNKDKYIDMPPDIAKLLKYENLYKSIKQDDLAQFADKFGKNYANKNSLLAMLLIAAANCGKKEFLPVAKENIKSPSGRVRFAAIYAFNILGGSI